VQWAELPQSLSPVVHGQPAWLAKQRPPVQWPLFPQSLDSRHVRSPVVGHSGAVASIGPGDSPPRHATTAQTIATTTMTTNEDRPKTIRNIARTIARNAFSLQQKSDEPPRAERSPTRTSRVRA